jgi:hypothetical protein
MIRGSRIKCWRIVTGSVTHICEFFYYYKLQIPERKIQNTLRLGKINIHKFHDSKFIKVKILNTENRNFLECFFRVRGCLCTIRKTAMSSSQGSKGQAVQMFLSLKIKARLFFETSFTNYPTTERNILEEFRRTETSITSLREFNLYIKLPQPLTFWVYNSVKTNPPFGHKFDNLKPVRVSLTLFL